MGTFVGGALLPHPPIMLPEVGGAELAKLAATVRGVEEAAAALMARVPETVVVISPHNLVFGDAVGISAAQRLEGSMGAFGFSDLRLAFAVDLGLAEQIARCCAGRDVPLASVTPELAARHGLEGIDKGSFVPLYYLHKAGFRGKVVLLSMGMLLYRRMMDFGAAVRDAVERADARVALIASGDLSHCLLPGSPNGYAPEGEVFDARVVEALGKLDVEALLSLDETLIHKAGECGLRPIFFLLGAVQEACGAPRVLSYEAPFGVGYGVVLFLADDVRSGAEKERSAPARLARRSLRHYLECGEPLPLPEDLAGIPAGRAGAFVSLKKRGQLRGCIGTFLPTTDSVAAEIVQNAVSAGTRDPRFPAVRREELDALTISVDVLGEPEPAQFEELDPQKYGVIVVCGERTGLLLPMLEGVDTAAQQVAIAKEKAGIAPEETAALYRFTVTRYV